MKEVWALVSLGRAETQTMFLFCIWILALVWNSLNPFVLCAGYFAEVYGDRNGADWNLSDIRISGRFQVLWMDEILTWWVSCRSRRCRRRELEVHIRSSCFTMDSRLQQNTKTSSSSSASHVLRERSSDQDLHSAKNTFIDLRSWRTHLKPV